jgi:hypothetical protein
MNTTIPCLPCESLDELLTFWQTLGFTVTYRQKAPNAYGVIENGDIAFHFFGLKQLAPESNFSTCLVIVPDVETLHSNYAVRLREKLGRFPAKGFPRLSRMRPGQSRFTVTDVAGNSVIFIKRGGEDASATAPKSHRGQTALQKAVGLAERLRDFKNDDDMAAKVLDDALLRNPDASVDDRSAALEVRLEIARVTQEIARISALEREIEQLKT